MSEKGTRQWVPGNAEPEPDSQELTREILAELKSPGQPGVAVDRKVAELLAGDESAQAEAHLLRAIRAMQESRSPQPDFLNAVNIYANRPRRPGELVRPAAWEAVGYALELAVEREEDKVSLGQVADAMALDMQIWRRADSVSADIRPAD